MSIRMSSSQYDKLIGNKSKKNKSKKYNKYKNVKINTKKNKYDSTEEFLRHKDLTTKERANLITNLRFHAKEDEIILQKDPEIKYIPDFCYNEGDYFIIEDVKGYQTKEFKIKKKLLICLLRAYPVNVKFRLTRRNEKNSFISFEEYIFLK